MQKIAECELMLPEGNHFSIGRLNYSATTAYKQNVLNIYIKKKILFKRYANCNPKLHKLKLLSTVRIPSLEAQHKLENVILKCL